MIPFESSRCVLAIMSGKVWREGKLWMSGDIKERLYFVLIAPKCNNDNKLIIEGNKGGYASYPSQCCRQVKFQSAAAVNPPGQQGAATLQ